MPKPIAEEKKWLVRINPQKLNPTKITGAALRSSSNETPNLESLLGGSIIHDFSKDAFGRNLQESGSGEVLMQLSQQKLDSLTGANPEAIVSKELDIEIHTAVDPFTAEARGYNPKIPHQHDFGDSSSGDGTFQRPNNSGEDCTVYILDNGVNPVSNEFGLQLKDGYNVFTGGPGKGADETTYHGTHVASIAAGHNFGVANQATIIPVKILQNNSARLSDILQGIYWVKKHHELNPTERPLANLSIQGMITTGATEFNQALKGLSDAGFIITLAAGNSGIDACSTLPGLVRDIPNLLVVENLDSLGQRSSTTNYGKCVDISYQGTTIQAYIGEGLIAVKSGTSMAAPGVLSWLADIWSANLNWSASQVIQHMKKTARILPGDVKLKSSPPEKTKNEKTVPSYLSHGDLSKIQINTSHDSTNKFFQPDLLTFPPLKDGQSVSFSCNIQSSDLKANKPLVRLALASRKVDIADYILSPSQFETKINIEFPKSGGTQQGIINRITESGAYWFKYYIKDGTKWLDIGKGTTIGAGKLDSISMETRAYIESAGGRVTRIALGKNVDGPDVTFSNFKLGSGSVPLGGLTDDNNITSAPTNKNNPQQTKTPTGKPTGKPTQLPTTSTGTPTRYPTTPYPTKKPTLPPTKKVTGAPTPKATKAPTKKVTRVPTPYPTKQTKSPTQEPTRPQLEVGDCQLINIEPPTKDYVFTLKVEQKSVIFKEGSVEVLDKDNKKVNVKNLGLKTNREAIASFSLDKGTRYMFQVSNKGNEFSISYTPLKKVKIKSKKNKKAKKGKQKFTYQAVGPMQEILKWQNSNKPLAISMPYIDAAHIKEDSALHGCDPVTGRMLKHQQPSYQLPNPPDSAGITAPMLFSTLATSAASAASQMVNAAHGYLLSSANTNQTEESSTTEPTIAQMVKNGLPLAAAAMTVLGLGYAYYTKKYTTTSKDEDDTQVDDDQEDQEDNPKFVDVTTLPIGTAEIIIRNVQGETQEQEETHSRKPTL